MLFLILSYGALGLGMPHQKGWLANFASVVENPFNLHFKPLVTPISSNIGLDPVIIQGGFMIGCSLHLWYSPVSLERHMLKNIWRPHIALWLNETWPQHLFSCFFGQHWKSIVLDPAKGHPKIGRVGVTLCQRNGRTHDSALFHIHESPVAVVSLSAHLSSPRPQSPDTTSKHIQSDRQAFPQQLAIHYCGLY